MVTWDIILHGLNISALIAFAWTVMRTGIPVALAVRDGLRDSAKALKELANELEDHEARIRNLEWNGKDRRGR